MNFDSVRAARGYWIAGLLLAVIGVGLARGAAPRFPDPTGQVLKTTGRIVAISGLIVISFGVSRRVKSKSEEKS